MNRAFAVEIDCLTKSFGEVRAVHDLTFGVRPGTVTGFLGPNGAGKTTTLRMLLGLIRPDRGSATFAGRRYVELDHPARVVGAALDATGLHPARSGRAHLRAVGTAIGVPAGRADAVLEQVGLSGAGHRRAGGYSLGMRQRLTLATALLGDPAVLVLDEPANGLDPEGIVWMRGLLRELADQGRTVLVSSHVLTEMQHLVDDVVIIADGSCRYAGPLHDLATRAPIVVHVRTSDPDRLRGRLEAHGATVRATADGLDVTGTDADQVGRIAHAEGLRLRWLTESTDDLERLFLDVTATTRSRQREDVA